MWVTSQYERAGPLFNEHWRPVVMLALHFEGAGPEFAVDHRGTFRLTQAANRAPINERASLAFILKFVGRLLCP